MKGVTRINENDLNRLVKKVLEEQNKPIPVDLYKNPDSVEKYCGTLKIPKEYIDSEIPNLIKKLNDSIEKNISIKLEKNPDLDKIPGSNKLKKTIERIIGRIKPYLERISTNGLYTTFGYSNYNPLADSSKILEIIYSELYNELQNDFKIKTLAKVFVNKKNVEDVKKVFLSILNKLSSSIDISVTLPSLYSKFALVTKFSKVRPRCEKVIVVVDRNMNKLIQSKQYHPKHPIYMDETLMGLDIDRLVKPYIPKINQIIDSFV
jgi:hypothetical protein